LEKEIVVPKPSEKDPGFQKVYKLGATTYVENEHNRKNAYCIE